MCDSIGQNLKSLLSLFWSLNLGLHTWASAPSRPHCSIFRVVWGGAPQAAGTAWHSAKQLSCELVLCCLSLHLAGLGSQFFQLLIIGQNDTLWQHMIVHTFDFSTRDRGRWLSWVWGQTALHSSFQDSQGYPRLKMGGRTHCGYPEGQFFNSSLCTHFLLSSQRFPEASV